MHDTMLPYAVPYARWILLAAPVSCASFVLNNTLRAEGESTLAMWGLGLGGVLNIVLDPLFIFTLDMGAGGAALATAVSQVVSFVILLAFFLTGRSIVRLRLRSVSRHFCDYWLIFSTGLPTVCRQGLGSVASAVLNMQAVLCRRRGRLGHHDREQALCLRAQSRHRHRAGLPTCCRL